MSNELRCLGTHFLTQAHAREDWFATFTVYVLMYFFHGLCSWYDRIYNISIPFLPEGLKKPEEKLKSVLSNKKSTDIEVEEVKRLYVHPLLLTIKIVSIKEMLKC